MFFLSWRQLIARKKQTLLILLGISLGTMLFVSISGVQLGIRNYIAEQLLNNTAHILIQGAESRVEPEDVTTALYGKYVPVRWVNRPSGLRELVRLENYGGWYEFLSRDPRVFNFVPRLSSQAVLSIGKFTSAVSLIGTVPEKQVQVSSIEQYMRAGRFVDLKGGNKIVIGSAVAHDLGIKVGQYVRVNSGTGMRPFKVVGIFHFGNEQVDRTLAFGSLSDVQVLAKSPGRVNQIAVSLYDIDDASAVADEWKLLTKDKVQDWMEANQAFMEMIKVQDFTRYFITTAILIVASFGIYNVLTIMINQKRREIAILRAIGYGPPRILQLVLYQGIVLGIGGGLLGLLLGFLMCRYIESIELNIEIGGRHNLFVAYDLSIYVLAFIAAMVSSLIASYIPARAASSMTPMDILRSE